jgi:hypothetical protein
MRARLEGADASWHRVTGLASMRGTLWLRNSNVTTRLVTWRTAPERVGISL